MKSKHRIKRLLSLVLVAALVVGAVPSLAFAQGKTPSNMTPLTLTPVDPASVQSQQLRVDTGKHEAPAMDPYAETDIVRVSIVLEKPSTIQAGFGIDNIAKNNSAMSYRNGLKSDQEAMIKKIQSAISGKLDVKWKLTLAANIISANVMYGQIDAIRAIDGVADVWIEKRYELDTVETGADPLMATSSAQIGSDLAWAEGYTGAGSRIAVIDTGVDKLHQSFDGDALMYSLAQNAAEAGMSVDEYIASLDLLDQAEIASLASQLNAKNGSISASSAYVSEKIPYGYNYVDESYYITHDEDTSSDHGSHVSGIATANKYIKENGEFVSALESVFVQGVAPDAQLITMKVFGKGGGAYTSDYMAAIEDAIILGCDSANLSLGSGQAGFGFDDEGYEDIMNMLVENGMVVSISAGNSYSWYDTPYYNGMIGYPYVDDNNWDTVGSPGSYQNALTVASVDNTGKTGKYLIFGDDLNVFYNEPEANNAPFSTLTGQTLQYIAIDGNGTTADFAALGSLVQGKVAIVSRGDITFVEKATNAVNAGAIATIIYNNDTGVINMAIDDYAGPQPVVSITQEDGAAIKAMSETHETDGGMTYYTGTLQASDGIDIYVGEVSEIQTMSTFSSWGVPSTLTMKPEITAPGGNIYSVNGYYKETNGQMMGGHDAYISYSGTSMAAPQVAGMAAVLGQYIRENGLEEATGLTQRQLINSLLMSTASPIFEDYGEDGIGYYPVIRIGAGIANVGAAVSAKSYLMMAEDATLFPDSAMDGKVKAELGDDPDRTGKYSYTFTIYPMEESKEFTLRTDLFTQYLFSYGELYADTWTVMLGALVTYDIDGEMYTNTALEDADVNMDGVTDAQDAQAILDYITGKLDDDAPFDDYAADVDQNYEITTYDAYLILQTIQSPTVTITEPTDVTVNISLSEGDMEFLDYYYTGGAYIEGYTYVEPVTSEEGEVTDVIHSIPILGYYGSWTDASMFDRTSVIDELYGTGKAPYLNKKNTNYLNLHKEGVNGDIIYTGNPYAVEEEFPADRLAMSSDTTIQSYNFMPIRNIGTYGAAIQDEEGTVIWTGDLKYDRYGPYYYVNGDSWQNLNTVNVNVGKSLGSLGLEEDDVITVGLYAIPEYNAVKYARDNGGVSADGTLSKDDFAGVLESGALGDGASIKYTVKIDNTAPEVLGAYQDLLSPNMLIQAKDNNYIAYVAVMNRGGTKVYAEAVPEQTEPGEEVSVPLDFGNQALPDTVVLLVADYAGNEAVFELSTGGSTVDYTGTVLAFTSGPAAPGSGGRALTIDPETLMYNSSTGAFEGLDVFNTTGLNVKAAEYVDGYVYMAADDGYIYAAKLNELDETSRVGSYMGTIYDLAYNYANDTLYALGDDNQVYSVDLITGEMTLVVTVTLPDTTAAANKMAIDADGTFYVACTGSGNNAKLFKFALEGTPGGDDPGDDPGDEPGGTVYEWGFEDGLDGWTAIDADGDGYNWTPNHEISSWYSGTPDYDAMAHTGTGCVLSGSYINTVGALTPDNWLVSPAFDLSEHTNAAVSFYLTSIDADYPEEVTVYAGTSEDPAEMTAVSEAITTPSEYEQYTVSLADYAGMAKVYVAFRNNGTYDEFLLALDLKNIER